jgi:hypothetical protein
MKKVAFPRGTTAENDLYVGIDGQVTVDTDRYEFRLHDGITPGGWRVLNITQLIQLFMSRDSEFGQVAFDDADRGVLTRVGDKQYALRLIKALAAGGILVSKADGVTVNQNGETDDFYLSIDPAYLSSLLSRAGRLVYAGLTTGTAAAMVATVPTGFPAVDGAILTFKCHVAPAAAATLTLSIVTPASTQGPYPIVTPVGSNKINEILPINTIVEVMRVNNTWVIVNWTVAKEYGIAPIAGLTALNIQDALAELKAGQVTGGSDLQPYRYDTDTTGNNSINVPMADNDRRLVMMTFQSAGSPQSSRLMVNGVEMIASVTHQGPSSTTSGGGSDGRDQNTTTSTTLYYNHLVYHGIMLRKGTKLYIGDIYKLRGRSGAPRAYNSPDLEQGIPASNTGWYSMYNLIDCGTVVANQVTISGGSTMSYSKLGVLFPG